MRLILNFQALTEIDYYKINNYTIQGLIYNLLKNTRFTDYHDTKGFKFFNFSNIFPVKDYDNTHQKTLIISSPNSKFIKTLYHSLKAIDYFYLAQYKMIIKRIKVFDSNINNKFISSTPLVLYEDNESNTYYSFQRNPDFDFFFNRLKDNALKKYNAFYNDEYQMNDELFNGFELSKEVSVKLTKDKKDFIIIGSIWKLLEKKEVKSKEDKKFYKFILDCGLGEKNSLGFGMVNNIQSTKKR
ncbi:MAG: CRISPR-associated endoribonuclease Cas6 [Methanobrevibacter sp.]|jgi:CRISPR-associated endoribonuclease Cas6|nr:CRISPR-associated endoribonuclease Cas6 [Candidatus Methanoflexus mossambicus]